VANWRRKALALFPDLRQSLQEPETTVYTVFFLLPHVGDVIASGDRQLLRSMFAFAEWCAEQPAKDLWNAAGVCFYEHLFDGGNWAHRAEVVKWLPPRVIADCWELWEHGLTPEKFAEVQRLICERTECLYREGRLAQKGPTNGTA
jgi:hypothetical protein